MAEPVKEIMKEIVGMEKKMGEWRILKYRSERIKDPIDGTPEELIDDLMEMSASELAPDNKEQRTKEAGLENKLTLDNLAEAF